jgi:cobalt-zinc-cadmium efflux system protein
MMRRALHDPESGLVASHDPSAGASAVFALSTLLNLALVIAQVIFGLLAHSTALLADATHNFGDVLGLLLAWAAHLLARHSPTERSTYGFRSSSIFAALLNAVVLLVATGAIVWEAIQRSFEPQMVAGPTVIVVAGVGIVVNGLAAWMFTGGHQHDLNIRGAYLHLLADAATSFGVVLAAGLIVLTGWLWVDPAASLVISGVIVWGTWGLLRKAVDMSLQAVPPDIELAAVRNYLESPPGVAQVHDLHIWSMSTTETALTCHIVMPRGHPGSNFLARIETELLERFRIHHPTIQIELGDRGCKLAPPHTV